MALSYTLTLSNNFTQPLNFLLKPQCYRESTATHITHLSIHLSIYR